MKKVGTARNLFKVCVLSKDLHNIFIGFKKIGVNVYDSEDRKDREQLIQQQIEEQAKKKHESQ